MIINLSTHDVYPEIQTDVDTGEWVGRLLTRSGSTVEEFRGEVDKAASSKLGDIVNCRNAAAAAAHKQFNKVLKKYKRGIK